MRALKAFTIRNARAQRLSPFYILISGLIHVPVASTEASPHTSDQHALKNCGGLASSRGPPDADCRSDSGRKGAVAERDDGAYPNRYFRAEHLSPPLLSLPDAISEPIAAMGGVFSCVC
jgi:hypothetical protein